MAPFGTMVLLPIPPERLLSPTVRFQEFLTSLPKTFLVSCPYPVFAMNPQDREYSLQHSPSGMEAHTSNYWMIFRGTTLLYASPLLDRRRERKTALFLLEVFSITRFRRCLEIGNLIQVCRPENWGPFSNVKERFLI